MARLGSLERGGFYATQDRIVELMREIAQPTGRGNILDPFAGEGNVLVDLAQEWGLTPYGVELHAGRFETMKEQVEAIGGKALHGPVEDAGITEGVFSVVYINPPYHMREEIEYSVDALKWVVPGGLAIIVIPEASAKNHRFLNPIGRQLRDIRIRVYPDPEYSQFKQVVIMGIKNYRPDSNSRYWNLENQITDTRRTFGEDQFAYMLPLNRPVVDFKMKTPDLAELLNATEAGVTTGDDWQRLTVPTAETGSFNPLETPKPGHTAMLIAAGAVNGTEIDSSEGRLLLKGSADKVVEEIVEQDGNKTKTIAREQIQATVTALNLDNGELTLLDGGTQEYQDFLVEHIEALREEISSRHNPLYAPERDWAHYAPFMVHYHAPGKLPGRDSDTLLPVQEQKTAAIAHMFRTQKAAILVGAMGTGKTTMSMAAMYLHEPRRYMTGKDTKIVVLCPPHLVKKWKREAEICLREFGVKAHIIKTVSDAETAMTEPGLSYLILKESTAKAGAGWKHSFTETRRQVSYVIEREVPYFPGSYSSYIEREQVERVEDVLLCPSCGHQPLCVDKEGNEVPLTMSALENVPGLKKRKHFCSECGGAMWQDIKLKSGKTRYPIATYLHRHHSGQFHLILDEVHQYKGRDSDRAYAASRLIAGAKKVIAMTGTIYGGKASSIFYLLFRLGIDNFPDRYGHADVGRFIDHYGLREQTTVEDTTSTNSWASGNKRYKRAPKEIPGAHPGMVNLLLSQTVFVDIEDLNVAMPEYTEHIHQVQLGDIAPQYTEVMVEWRADAIAAWMDGSDPGEFSRWLQAALGYPDCPGQAEVGGTGKHYAMALPTPDKGFSKDQEVVALIKQEVEAGKRVYLYCGQVHRRDPRPRIAKLLEKHGIKAVSMGSVSSSKREEWIQKQVKAGVHVIMSHPQKVETGLDLLEFPTLIYLGIPTYSIYTILQSKLRSWRLGQTHPVNVHFFVYQGLQAIALDLLSEKAKAADLINGKMSEGLAAMNTSSDSFEREIMKLLQTGEADTQMETWKATETVAMPLPVFVPEPVVEVVPAWQPDVDEQLAQQNKNTKAHRAGVLQLDMFAALAG